MSNQQQTASIAGTVSAGQKSASAPVSIGKGKRNWGGLSLCRRRA